MNEEELAQAACSGKDVNIFFPEGPPGTVENSTRYAKAICAGCPVAVACLQQALQENMSGIWGGTTDQERRAIRLNRRSIVVPLKRK